MKRLPELDRLVQSAYGDKVMGRVPENLCVQLLNGYEVERAAKQERRKVLCELLSARREKDGIPVSKGSSHNAFWISASVNCSK